MINYNQNINKLLIKLIYLAYLIQTKIISMKFLQTSLKNSNFILKLTYFYSFEYLYYNYNIIFFIYIFSK